MKLNLGDGGVELPGYVGLDIARGEDVAVLPYENSSIDEIRASHVLEHFGFADVRKVLKEWVRVLRPGGELKISVPDFRILAEQYLAGAPMPIQNYVMGGQSNEHDFHKSLFDAEALADVMREAGLVGLTTWKGDGEDTASNPLSLNLAGYKIRTTYPTVAAFISMPRLGFNDFWACALKELTALRIPLTKLTGAYWDNVLEMGIKEHVRKDKPPDWILTFDYDTVFTRDQVISLLETAMRRPHIDALAPVQIARHGNAPLLTLEDQDGHNVTHIKRTDLQKGAVLKSNTAHFGMTLLKTEKLRELSSPWFERRFGENACDPDIGFWRKWKEHGFSLYTALRVPIGHCELMVKWPNLNLETTYQLPQEFLKTGPPEDVWR